MIWFEHILLWAEPSAQFGRTSVISHDPAAFLAKAVGGEHLNTHINTHT